MEILYRNLLAFRSQDGIMIAIGCLLIFLAIRREMEPALLLPLGFGTVLVNIPGSDALTGPIQTLYQAGIANELFPLLLFIGIGAMIDFGPLLADPRLMLFGAAAQGGIFLTLCLASMFFPQVDAAAIAVIGAADGPTAIAVANVLGTRYAGAITVAAYSYMALVPILQPPVIRLLTTPQERKIRMPYTPGAVSHRTRILFPILITLLSAAILPQAAGLIGFLMFGNLLRECGVLETLAETARSTLTHGITILLGLSVSFHMTADKFLQPDSLLILGLGLFAFLADTAMGVLFAKAWNLVVRKKINPMIGAAGISAFPMSGRIVHKMGLAEDPHNFLLMHAIGANVSGQIASVIAGGLLLYLFS